MNEQSHIYEFGGFRFDADKHILRHNDKIVKNIEPKPLEVLAALLTSGDEVTTYDEIKNKVWGVKSSYGERHHITPHISTLKRIFAEYEPETEFIETMTNRGYRFVGGTLVKEATSNNQIPTPANNSEMSDEKSSVKNKTRIVLEQLQPTSSSEKKKTPQREFQWKQSYTYTLIIVIFLVSVGLGLFLSHSSEKSEGQKIEVTQPPQEQRREVVQSPSDEEEIRRVVKESQMFETFEVYFNPATFDEKKLEKYFLTEEQGGKEIPKIKAAVNNLIQKERHYGKESKLERFDIKDVKVFSPRDYAELKSDESWYLPAYEKDGSPAKEKNVYIAGIRDYSLRKINGRWLIEENSTPRVKPTPN